MFFLKKIVFTPLICYGLSDVVYWYLLVRLLVELFISKRPNTSRNCNQKKKLQLGANAAKVTAKKTSLSEHSTTLE